MAVRWFAETRIPLCATHIHCERFSVYIRVYVCLRLNKVNLFHSNPKRMRKLVVSKTNTCYATRSCCSWWFFALAGSLGVSSPSFSVCFSCSPLCSSFSHPFYRMCLISYQINCVYIKTENLHFACLLCIASVLLVVFLSVSISVSFSVYSFLYYCYGAIHLIPFPWLFFRQFAQLLVCLWIL